MKIPSKGKGDRGEDKKTAHIILERSGETAAKYVRR